MNQTLIAVRRYFTDLVAAWDRFWFAPSDPAVLCAIRVVAGLLLFWTHLVWSFDLLAFFGSGGWIPAEMSDRSHAARYAFSLFDVVTASWAIWTFHAVNLIAFAMLTIGLFSRCVAVWSFFAAIQYALHVTPGAFFGLDKINCMLAMYLMLGPCGARYSVDRLLRVRAGRAAIDADDVPPSWTATYAVRLLQLHLCVIYLFGGLGKLQGDRWWDGTAIWFAVANVEYRSLDSTWMADCLWLGELLAHATVFFELFYCCLIWSHWTRPWVLLTAVGVHGFIGLAMGMPEFSAAMLTANAAFLPAGTVRGALDPVTRLIGSRLTGVTDAESPGR